ncbi:MAG TPA: imidazole glycerol phosphate synthase subunit HisH, partial [Candidatus Omnitrophota bacterium]|nr:imidazole glycerol phosphate synthase subunit HisH [Candidatus Omnitrophota bacterium]
MIAIIDYGSGNLKSVYNAFRYLGASARVCDKPAMLDKAEKIVFPGVGSSEDAIAGLKKRGMVEPMIGNIKNGKAFLGICLGLQLLFENSEESGGTECMGLIKGNVPVFSKKKGLKIPQIGWNTVKIENKKCPLFRGIRDNSYFYFVHSYYFDPVNEFHT